MAGNRQPKLNRPQLVDCLLQHGNALFEVAMLAQGPPQKGRSKKAKRSEPMLLRKGDQLPSLTHQFSFGAAKAEHPTTHISLRERRRVRMAKGVGGLERVEPNLKGFIDMAKTKKRE